MFYIYILLLVYTLQERNRVNSGRCRETLVVLYNMFCYSIFINIYVVLSRYAVLTVICNGSRYVAMLEKLITRFSNSRYLNYKIIFIKIDFIKYTMDSIISSINLFRQLKIL